MPWWPDILLPGLGLAAERRAGAPCAVLAGLGLGLAAAAPALDPAAPLPWVWGGLAAWAAAAAVVLAVRLRRTREPDPAAVRAAWRAASAAYLRGDLGGAEAHAATLCRLAPGEPGAWELRARIARRAGRDGGAYARRAARLADRG
ncbi:MAG: hypothetical protein RLZZ127_3200 [Planctomycetota bacterium]|jgi:hypothetical protein